MDIALVLKAGEKFDISMKNQDLETDAGLKTAAIISLFTDRRVGIEELPSRETDQRGWWGDMFSQVDQDQIGSRLWLLQRSKQTDETLSQAREYCLEALAWMVEDGLAASLNVITSYASRGIMHIEITIQKPKGNINYRYQFNWNFESVRE